MNAKKSVAVIGAGIAGLTCAYELNKAGFKVTVFERESYVGGRMSTDYDDGLAFDRGANFLAQGYSTLKGYVKEFGLEKDWLLIENDRHVVYRQGKFYDLGLETLSRVLSLKAVGLWGRFRLLVFLLRLRLTTPSFNFFDLTSVPEEYDLENAYDYFSRHIGRETVEYLIDSYTRTMQFHSARDISTGAALALFSVMGRGDGAFDNLHMRRWMSQIPDEMAKRLRVQLKRPIRNIRSENGKVLVTPVKGKKETFDLVVLACPAPQALDMIEKPTPEQKELLSQTRYAKTVNVSFKIPVHSLKTIKCTYVPYCENKTISEFTNESRKLITKGDKTLVNIGLHEEAAEKIMSKSDKEIFSIVGREFEKIHPAVTIEPHRLWRLNQAMPKFSTGHLTRVTRFFKSSQGQNNIYLCGDYMNSPWTEGAARCGKKVAELIEGKREHQNL